MSGESARRIASELDRRGLTAPARLLLDAHRPLVPLLSDAGVAIAPFLRLVGRRSADDLARLLEDDGGMEDLIAELDHAGERSAEPG